MRGLSHALVAIEIILLISAFASYCHFADYKREGRGWLWREVRTHVSSTCTWAASRGICEER